MLEYVGLFVTQHLSQYHINRITDEKARLEQEFATEKDVIKEEFQKRIDDMTQTVEDCEKQIKVKI